MYSQETAHTIAGVPGRMFARHVRPDRPDLFSAQKWISEARAIKGYDVPAVIRAEIRFDDQCKNGHATFSITGDIRRKDGRGPDNGWLGGGCCHEDIATAFPELAHLIRWHLTSTDAPMHYVANAIYHASDRDAFGKRAGEPSRFETMIRFADVPMAYKVPRGLLAFLQGLEGYDPEGKRAAMIPLAVGYVDTEKRYSTAFGPKWQFAGQPPLKWHECPFDSEDDAQRFAASFIDHSPVIFKKATAWSEGKARDLDAARRAAIWPEATDEELTAEPAVLRAQLEARLPSLQAAFRADMEAAGLLWEPAATKGDA